MRKAANCSIDWFSESYTTERDCPMENLHKLFNLLILVRETSLSNLSSTTGCHPRCEVRHFSLERKSEEKVNWTTDWTSSLYLEPKTNMNERREEFYTYDIGDLLGDIGGYLGLWLGWSVLTFFKEMPFIAVKVLTVFKKRLSQKSK